MNTNNLLAGLGGALVLTLLNESLKKVNEDMPRIDLVGEQAIQKAATHLGYEIDDVDSLIGTALVGDIISNATYYSLINGEGKELWTKAVSSGLLAGLGAINLPSKLELNDAPVAKSMTTKVWTMGYYMIGALTTATVLQFLKKY
ncbi:hypothetical protein [Flavobacterium agrisoli]|uniref:Uncharacterized protein n=1 Tax=Flavobacterium agrisoli TaxID=2793066 RepID=A0A934PPA2_9FLAO|nr:hypothetical protein [Flavobacterium agrisoli]MBK0370093.1 hypothetical protein [Flavobacterium agrisoli]